MTGILSWMQDGNHKTKFFTGTPVALDLYVWASWTIRLKLFAPVETRILTLRNGSEACE